MSQPNHPMYAVLIGIDEYENAATLEGPTQDLKLMGDLCDSLKILKKNRKVLAGKGATVAKIQSALDWLEEALDDENATALVHFSGHGTLFNQSGLDDTLALAAYDFAPDAQASASDQGLLTIRALAARFGKPKRKATETVKLTPSKKDEVTTAHLDALAETKLARITFVLDCCWNQEELSSSTCVHLPLMSYRMFLGCSRNDAANEIWMDGQKVGAFTWALTTALSRWTVKQHDGNQQMTVTHAKLMDRVHHLFSALSIKGQTPMLAGPRVLDILPVFQRSMDWDAGAVVSEEPDVVDDHRQLWGGEQGGSVFYQLYWSPDGSTQGSEVACVTAANKATRDGQEQWTLFWQAATSLLTASSLEGSVLTITELAQPPNQPVASDLDNPVPSWSWPRRTAPQPQSPTPQILPGAIWFELGSQAMVGFEFQSTPSGTSTVYTLMGIQWLDSTAPADPDDPTFDPTNGDSSGAQYTYASGPPQDLSTWNCYPPQQPATPPNWTYPPPTT